MQWNATTQNNLTNSKYSSKYFINGCKTCYSWTPTKTQIYAFIVHAHFSLAEQSPDARCDKKKRSSVGLLGVLLWVISLFSQGVCSPEGELWRTCAWAVKQDRPVSGKHLHSEFIPKNRVTAKRTYSETRTKRTGYMQSVPSASWFFFFVSKFWLLGSSGP